ncbi:DNAK protein [Trypanosoma rangeli SC58]|nr:DNAK protein [Trypanosoma rangeli SC58]
MSVLIPRNTTVPTQQSQTFSTNADNQRSVEIKVYEGERPLVSQCQCLGTFTLTDIPPAPRGKPRIKVSFDVNTDGILVVSAVEEMGGKTHAITITNDRGRLSKDQIEKMVKEAEQFANEDRVNAERIEAHNALENYTFSLRATLGDPEVEAGVSLEDRQKIHAVVNTAAAWLDGNPGATKEEYDAKTKEIEQVAHPILSAFYMKRTMERPHEPSATAAAPGEEGGASAPPPNDVD